MPAVMRGQFFSDLHRSYQGGDATKIFQKLYIIIYIVYMYLSVPMITAEIINLNSNIGVTYNFLVIL